MARILTYIQCYVSYQSVSGDGGVVVVYVLYINKDESMLIPVFLDIDDGTGGELASISGVVYEELSF